MAAAFASLDCGNPTALADLVPGEKVLDLLSEGGASMSCSQRGTSGQLVASGLDMPDAMREIAEGCRVEAGRENVRFLQGIREAPSQRPQGQAPTDLAAPSHLLPGTYAYFATVYPVSSRTSSIFARVTFAGS